MGTLEGVLMYYENQGMQTFDVSNPFAGGDVGGNSVPTPAPRRARWKARGEMRSYERTFCTEPDATGTRIASRREK